MPAAMYSAASSGHAEAHAANSMQQRLMSSEHLSFTLLGAVDFPLVEVLLPPGQSMCAEPGRLIQLPRGVRFCTVMGDGSRASLLTNAGRAVKRVFSGESMVLARFTNNANEAQLLRFGTVVPGNVVPLKLSDYGGQVIAMNGAYLCGSDALKVEPCFGQKLGAAFFGGESLILQKVMGSGEVLLQAGGTVLKEVLTPDRPTIRVSAGCLVAFTVGLIYDIVPVGSLKSWLFGGEGMFLATITLPPGQEGSGIVWVESFPYSAYIARIKSLYPH